jgi:integrase
MPQGHLPWHSDEMDQYANHFDYGTKARLAFELLLQLGQSKCDIVRIGPQHVKDGMLVFSRKKTGVEFTCEILPPLRTAIEAMGKPKAINGVVPLTFLVTEQGKPFSANGFSAKLRQWTDEASLPRKDAETGKPRCTAHGLRKSSATRMADMGVPLHDMMRWFGWKTPEEALHYIETAEKRKAAKRTAAKVAKIEKVKNRKGSASVKPKIPV